MKGTCDECKNEFEIEIETKYLGAMITETCFVCPHCSEKYIIKLDNSLTRKLQKNIIKLKKALQSNTLTNDVRETLNKVLDNNINFHRKAMSLLMKGEYSWRYKN